ncbi:LOW QUALITY PROTEIN: hypothetical protein V2J09_001536 [Rumex salicifolius]
MDKGIRFALSQIGSYKASGVDEYHAIFFKSCWETSVTRLVVDFFKNKRMANGLNDTAIALIGKVASPETISQFRPISLCNVLYKLITKMLCLFPPEELDKGTRYPLSVQESGNQSTCVGGAPILSHLFFADDILLMDEASPAQMQVVMNCINTFCSSSGQKVNISKCRIYVSKNVSRETANQLEQISGMDVTRDLVTNKTFDGLLDKVKAWLLGWKCRTLSLAGRVTLTKAVLGSLPVYSMNSLRLPVGTFNRLNQISCSFVWGECDGKRKMCGLISVKRSLKVGRLGWWLMSNRAGIWGNRILQTKSTKESYIWNGIKWSLQEVIKKGKQWNVNNGVTCRYWANSWLLDTPLERLAITSIALQLLNRKMSDFWIQGHGWNWDLLHDSLPSSILLKLAAFRINEDIEQVDVITWGPSDNGDYSTASAYELDRVKQQSLDPHISKALKRIWKIKVQERIRFFLWQVVLGKVLTNAEIFLWQVVLGKVLTNAERFRRHLSSSDLCTRCRAPPETLLHLFRDCDVVKRKWLKLVPPDKQGRFFTDGAIS